MPEIVKILLFTVFELTDDSRDIHSLRSRMGKSIHTLVDPAVRK